MKTSTLIKHTSKWQQQQQQDQLGNSPANDNWKKVNKQMEQIKQHMTQQLEQNLEQQWEQQWEQQKSKMEQEQLLERKPKWTTQLEHETTKGTKMKRTIINQQIKWTNQ